MLYKLHVKRILETIPISIGKRLSYIPFNYRLGNSYNAHKKNINFIEKSDIKEKKYKIFWNFRNILEYCINTIPFYKEYYKLNNFSLNNFKTFDDIQNIPIINKKILNNYQLNLRTNKKKALGLFNTGGTSGNPLSFYLENSYYSKEWAHMHNIWGILGYKQSDIKLTFRGKNIGNQLYKYNFVNNEIFVNIFRNLSKDDYIIIAKLIEKHNIKYIHGYPSAIYAFLKKDQEYGNTFIKIAKNYIKSIFYSSEYPIPFYRDFIDGLLEASSISWYGHTEGIILAPETNKKFSYMPLLSYGFAESIKIDNKFHLIGTSFDNTASPFIRYDTGDLITPTFIEGLLSSFEIKEGREGEFIEDFLGHKISLTGLIFGRHHKLFNYVDFIQVKQGSPGKAEILFVTNQAIYNPASLFDSSNIEIYFTFKQIPYPIMSKSGKIQLLVP